MTPIFHTEPYIIELIGTLAALLSTISFVPQVVKVWRTRSARDLSLIMYLMFWVGIFLWLLFGLMIGSISVITGNLVTLCLASTILYFKLRYG